MTAELQLCVCRDLRHAPVPAHTTSRDQSASAMRLQVMEQGRFGGRCFYCGFGFGASEDYEISHLDGDHANHRQDNLVPVCELCHCGQHLDLLHRKWPDAQGKIIFLPELSQAELNNLLQAIFYAMAMQMNSAGGSAPVEGIHPHTVYTRLGERARQMEQDASGRVVRPGLSNPFVFARLLGSMDDADYARRDELLAGARYLPEPDYFVERARQWNRYGAAFAALDLAHWQALAQAGG